MTTRTDQRTCPSCGRPASVTVTGRLRKHKSRLATMDRVGGWCDNTSPYGQQQEKP